MGEIPAQVQRTPFRLVIDSCQLTPRSGWTSSFFASFQITINCQEDPHLCWKSKTLRTDIVKLSASQTLKFQHSLFNFETPSGYPQSLLEGFRDHELPSYLKNNPNNATRAHNQNSLNISINHPHELQSEYASASAILSESLPPTTLVQRARRKSSQIVPKTSYLDFRLTADIYQVDPEEGGSICGTANLLLAMDVVEALLTNQRVSLTAAIKEAIDATLEQQQSAEVLGMIKCRLDIGGKPKKQPPVVTSFYERCATFKVWEEMCHKAKESGHLRESILAHVERKGSADVHASIEIFALLNIVDKQNSPIQSGGAQDNSIRDSKTNKTGSRIEKLPSPFVTVKTTQDVHSGRAAQSATGVGENSCHFTRYSLLTCRILFQRKAMPGLFVSVIDAATKRYLRKIVIPLDLLVLGERTHMAVHFATNSSKGVLLASITPVLNEKYLPTVSTSISPVPPDKGSRITPNSSPSAHKHSRVNSNANNSPHLNQIYNNNNSSNSNNSTNISNNNNHNSNHSNTNNSNHSNNNNNHYSSNNNNNHYSSNNNNNHYSSNNNNNHYSNNNNNNNNNNTNNNNVNKMSPQNSYQSNYIKVRRDKTLDRTSTSTAEVIYSPELSSSPSQGSENKVNWPNSSNQIELVIHQFSQPIKHSSAPHVFFLFASAHVCRLQREDSYPTDMLNGAPVCPFFLNQLNSTDSYMTPENHNCFSVTPFSPAFPMVVAPTWNAILNITVPHDFFREESYYLALDYFIFDPHQLSLSYWGYSLISPAALSEEGLSSVVVHSVRNKLKNQLSFSVSLKRSLSAPSASNSVLSSGVERAESQELASIVRSQERKILQLEKLFVELTEKGKSDSLRFNQLAHELDLLKQQKKKEDSSF